MRTIFAVTSMIFLVVGALGMAMAAALLICSWAAPIQPPPSLNEGPALARFIGWGLLLISVPALVVGAAMMVGLRRSRSADEIARALRHKRLW